MAISAQAISCSNVRGVFPVHERFWLCLVQVSATKFCSFTAFLMARVSDGTNVLISPAPASSSNLGSLNGSLPDLEGVGGHSQLVSQPWKRMQRPSPVGLARQDLGRFSDIVMAPQPLDLLDPMVEGHLITIEIQDEGLLRSQAPKMNKREVPYYFDSLVSNTTKENYDMDQ